jgi:hypothetical protein
LAHHIFTEKYGIPGKVGTILAKKLILFSMLSRNADFVILPTNVKEDGGANNKEAISPSNYEESPLVDKLVKGIKKKMAEAAGVEFYSLAPGYGNVSRLLKDVENLKLYRYSAGFNTDGDTTADQEEYVRVATDGARSGAHPVADIQRFVLFNGHDGYDKTPPPFHDLGNFLPKDVVDALLGNNAFLTLAWASFIAEFNIALVEPKKILFPESKWKEIQEKAKPPETWTDDEIELKQQLVKKWEVSSELYNIAIKIDPDVDILGFWNASGEWAKGAVAFYKENKDGLKGIVNMFKYKQIRPWTMGVASGPLCDQFVSMFRMLEESRDEPNSLASQFTWESGTYIHEEDWKTKKQIPKMKVVKNGNEGPKQGVTFRFNNYNPKTGERITEPKGKDELEHYPAKIVNKVLEMLNKEVLEYLDIVVPT